MKTQFAAGWTKHNRSSSMFSISYLTWIFLRLLSPPDENKQSQDVTLFLLIPWLVFLSLWRRLVILEPVVSVSPFVIFTSVFMHENVSDLTLVCVNLPGISSVIWETCKLMCLLLCLSLWLGLVAMLTQHRYGQFSVLHILHFTMEPRSTVLFFLSYTGEEQQVFMWRLCTNTHSQKVNML